MEDKKILKNVDVDGTFLSLSLNERLYLNDNRYFTKSGFNVFKPQVQKQEPQTSQNFYNQDFKQNPKTSAFKPTQTNPLQEIEFVKQHVLNSSGFNFQYNCQKESVSNFPSEELESLKSKIGQTHSSIDELKNQFKSLENFYNEKTSDQQLDEIKKYFDIKFQKVNELDTKCNSYEKIPNELEGYMDRKVSLLIEQNSLQASYIISQLETKMNDKLTEFFDTLQSNIIQKIETKFGEQLETFKSRAEIKSEPKEYEPGLVVRTKSLKTIKKKSKSNQYHLLTKLKNMKRKYLSEETEEEQNFPMESLRTGRRVRINDQVEFFSQSQTQQSVTFSDLFQLNDGDGKTSQDSNDSIFEVEF